jgi:hypothetical protein
MLKSSRFIYLIHSGIVSVCEICGKAIFYSKALKAFCSGFSLFYPQFTAPTTVTSIFE